MTRHKLSRRVIAASRTPLIGLSALVLAGLFASGVFSQQGSLAGDADGDGFLTPLDRGRILQHILGTASASGDADFNGDGTIDIADWVGLTEFFFDIPAELVSVDASMAAALVAPGGSSTLSWTISGDRDLDELEVLVRARAPGNVVTSTDATFLTPGVIPANGPVSFLAPDRSWSSSEQSLGVALASQAEAIILPSATTGEWGFDVIVRSGDSFVGWGSASVIAADHPGIRLRRNRPVANTDDVIRLELLTFNPGPGLITPMIRLELPDKSQISLPDYSDDFTFADSVAPGEVRTDLLFEELAPSGEGEYRLLARALASDNSLAAMASTGFLVCDQAAMLTGQVKAPDGTPVDGTASELATVSAFDLHDAVPTTTTIAANGSYSLDLSPGVYAVTATVESVSGTVSVDVGCGGEAVEQDITLEQNLQPLRGVGATESLRYKPARSHRTMKAQTASGLPAQGVFFQLLVPNDFPEDQRRMLEDRYANRAAQQNPEIDTPRMGELQEAMERAAEMALLTELDESSDLAAKIAEQFNGYQFFCQVRVFDGGPDCGFTVSTFCVDRYTGDTFGRAEKACVAESDLPTAVEDVADDSTGGGSLQDEVEQRTERPIQPRLNVELSETLVRDGNVIEVKIRLVDVDGEPLEDEQVTVKHKPPGLVPVEDRAADPTDSNGEVTVPVLAAGDGPGWFEVSYVSARGKRASFPRRYYEVDPNAGAAAGRFFITKTGRLGVQAGDTAELEVSVDTTSAFPPQPVPDGTVLFGFPADTTSPECTVPTPPSFCAAKPAVELLETDCSLPGCPTVGSSPGGGTLSTTAIALGPSKPRDTLDFQAGANSGLVRVNARFTCTLCDPDDNLLRDDALIAIIDNVQFSVSVGGSGSSSPESHGWQEVTEDQFTGPVPIQASLVIDDSLVDAQAIQFSVQGDGAVAVANTQTDAFGLAGTTFVPPATTGTSELIATAVINGESYTKTVDIDYEAPPLAFTMTEVLFPPAWDEIQIVDVNDSGVLVGTANFSEEGAFLWSQSSGLLPFGPLPFGTGFPIQSPVRINNNSVVVGGDGAGFNAWVWSADTGFTDLASRFPTTMFSSAFDINDSGRIVGCAQESESSADVIPYTLIGGGQPQFLQLPAGSSEGCARFINNQDQILGDTLGDPAKILFWDTAGAAPQIIDITALQGVQQVGFAAALNDLGQALVGDSFNTALWDGGSLTPLTGFDTSQSGRLDGLSNDGIAVGTTGRFSGEALLWVDTQYIRLADLIVDTDPVPPLDKALAISSNSRFIVVQTTVHDGRRIFLLERVGSSP